MGAPFEFAFSWDINGWILWFIVYSRYNELVTSISWGLNQQTSLGPILTMGTYCGWLRNPAPVGSYWELYHCNFMGLQWDKPSTNGCRISAIHSMITYVNWEKLSSLDPSDCLIIHDKFNNQPISHLVIMAHVHHTSIWYTLHLLFNLVCWNISIWFDVKTYPCLSH